MKDSVQDSAALWKRICLQDDMAAFDSLFRTLHARLITFCVLYVYKREIAEEIVSDVFVRCWERRKTLAHIDHPDTYLFVAVKNQSLNYLKKISTVHLVQIEASRELVFVNTLDPQKEMERKELQFLLDQAIATLPRQACIIFKLIKEDGMKYKQVAAILNISPRTVQTQLFRAIKKLHDIILRQQLIEVSSVKRKD